MSPVSNESPRSVLPVGDRGVLVVRHGQSLWNAAGRWQGWADVALSDEGLAQARSAAEVLRQLLDGYCVEVVSSDLERARQTADTFSAVFGVTVSAVLPGLRERSVGDWTGRTTDEIESTWPGQLDAWRRGELDMIPGGEHESDLAARILDTLTHLCEHAHHRGVVVVAVAHGGVIRTLTRRHGAQARAMPNLGATWFAWRSGTTAHLGELDLLDPAVVAAPRATVL